MKFSFYSLLKALTVTGVFVTLCLFPTDCSLIWNGYHIHTKTVFLLILYLFSKGLWYLLIYVFSWSGWLLCGLPVAMVRKLCSWKEKTPQSFFVAVTQALSHKKHGEAKKLLTHAQKLFPQEPYWTFLNNQIPSTSEPPPSTDP